MFEFGAELKQMREQQGLSISQISKDVGLHKSSWSRYERNEHGMGLDTYLMLCKHFNKSIGFKREWETLTNDEINECITYNNITVVDGDVYEFVKSLEFLIKWKNQQ